MPPEALVSTVRGFTRLSQLSKVAMILFWSLIFTNRSKLWGLVFKCLLIQLRGRRL